jgi:predicted O-methyltransferase YrrM
MNIEQAKTLRAHVRRGLRDKGYTVTEGSCSPEEMKHLANLVALTDIRLVAEIGFNAGYSTHAMLSERPDVEVVSFDICKHNYCKAAKDIIDDMYPNQHSLVIGDSTIMVPNYADMNPTEKFDMVFIDGGHSYKVAKADLLNMRRLVRKGGPVVMDDVTPHRRYGMGPHRAWTEAKEDGFIQELEIRQDGEWVEEPTQAGTHVWAVGFYQ